MPPRPVPSINPTAGSLVRRCFIESAASCTLVFNPIIDVLSSPAENKPEFLVGIIIEYEILTQSKWSG
jgi:hypothetical protein